ncbi:hypothetical protein [Klebsiella pneumoniae]|nr:hypothetical protein [Klebsiella pneumoniae]
MLSVIFRGVEIGASDEEIESRVGDHPLLVEAEKIVATALSRLPDELFFKSDRINAGLMEKWKSMEA